MTRIFSGIFAAALTLAACGGTTVFSTGSSSGSGTGATGTSTSTVGSTSSNSASTSAGVGSTSSGTVGTGGGASVGCPASKPSGSCAGFPNGLSCTYGDSVRPDCRELTTCQSGEWETAGTACSMSTGCPATQPGAGDSCGLEGGTECTFGDTICYCGCGGGPACAPPLPWTCTPPPDAPCPGVAPNDGTSCTDSGLTCTYGDPCTGGAQVDCTGGFWRWNRNIPCPV